MDKKQLKKDVGEIREAIHRNTLDLSIGKVSVANARMEIITELNKLEKEVTDELPVANKKNLNETLKSIKDSQRTIFSVLSMHNSASGIFEEVVSSTLIEMNETPNLKKENMALAGLLSDASGWIGSSLAGLESTGEQTKEIKEHLQKGLELNKSILEAIRIISSRD